MVYDGLPGLLIRISDDQCIQDFGEETFWKMSTWKIEEEMDEKHCRFWECETVETGSRSCPTEGGAVVLAPLNLQVFDATVLVT